jgi:hypothetical protein
MSDRRFIDLLIDATLLRIEGLMTRTFEHAAREVQVLDSLASSLGRAPLNDPLQRPEPELLRAIWRPALNGVATRLLWGVADQAVDGRFPCTADAVAAVVDRVNRVELERETGVGADDLRFILREMGAALCELVAKEPVELMIDRRAIMLTHGAQRR